MKRMDGAYKYTHMPYTNIGAVEQWAEEEVEREIVLAEIQIRSRN